MVERIGFFTALFTVVEIHVIVLAAQTVSRFCTENLKKISDFGTVTIYNAIPRLLAGVVLLALYIVSYGMTMITFMVEAGLAVSILYTVFFGAEGDFRVTYYSADAAQKMLNDYSNVIMPMVRPELKNRIIIFSKLFGMLERYGTVILLLGSSLYLLNNFQKFRYAERSLNVPVKAALLLVLHLILVAMTSKLFVASLYGIPAFYSQIRMDWNEYILYHKYRDIYENNEL